jgi:hypothetical protein
VTVAAIWTVVFIRQSGDDCGVATAQGSSGTALIEILPYVILQSIRAWELLNEVLDSVLPQTEKVWSRDRVTMLPVPNMVRRAHDDRPGTSGCACNDGLICHIICNDLEFGPITAIMDGAIINCLRIGITRREIAPVNGIAHGKDVALRMEVLSHTHLTQAIDSHDPDIQRKYGPASLVTGDHGNRVAF